jgi:xanthine dehydrogenase accessory factor
VNQLYKEIVRLLNKGDTAILATVIEQAGSAPRKSGAQMVIRGDGSSLGTVGGGRLEAECMIVARTVMAERRAQTLSLHLTGTDVAGTTMICGGGVEVYIEPLSASLLDVYTKLLELQEEGKEAVLVSRISTAASNEEAGGKALVMADGRFMGPLALNDEALVTARTIFAERQPRLIPYHEERLYLEPVFPAPTLYLFGAGHISRSIAPMASLVGFQVIVIDDRAEFANRDSFPLAQEIWVEEFDGIGKKIEGGADAYAVIVTRGHMYDHAALRQVLPRGCRYIGMIGSHRKRDIIYKELIKEGYTRADLASVHSPIGLEIGAETPEEIAVSIVAELIKVRAEEALVHEKALEV